jgi:hypothetical protein
MVRFRLAIAYAMVYWLVRVHVRKAMLLCGRVFATTRTTLHSLVK